MITIFKKLKRLINAYNEYLKLKRTSKLFNKNISRKKIIIHIENSDIYNRYFYTFLKFFSIEGYTIYFPRLNFQYFRNNIYKRNLQPWNYYNLIFKEGLISLDSVPAKSKLDIEITDKNLSADFFTNFFKMEFEFDNVYVPMTMHPLFYHYKYWDRQIKLLNKRKHSVFMIGNLDRCQYEDFKNKPFNINSRIEVFDYLKRTKKIKEIESNEQLDFFIDGDNDLEIILLDSKSVYIEMSKLRETISRFSFYLALAGVAMPFSHNLIEALSVGTIPIIQKNYAKLMIPNLVHMKNAIIYNDLEDLTFKIDIAFNLNTEKIDELINNVLLYYNSNLLPTSVVNKVRKNQNRLIYLQAEHLSVKILENNIFSKKLD